MTPINLTSSITTGIAALDQILGGGIPRRQTLIVTGNPGTGKTILCSEIAFAFARRNENVVFATMTSEAQDKLLEELSGFAFYDGKKIGNEIFLTSAYAAARNSPKETREVLLDVIRSRKAKLLILDGLRVLRDLWGNEAELRQFLYEMTVAAAQYGAIVLIAAEYPVEQVLGYPEATTTDGMISLACRRVGGRMIRRIQVVKLRGRRHYTGEHFMEITKNGIRIVPRLEETVARSTMEARPPNGRAPFGLTELDRSLHGGLPCESATLLAGSTGVGKTLLGLCFAANGAEGHPGLLVSYSEAAEKLVSRAQGVGLDVRPQISAGTLEIMYRSPLDVEADELIAEVLASVDRFGARRLVIDSLGELESSVVDKERVRELLTALIVELRRRGVTTIFVKEVSKIAGPDLDFSDTPISVTAENMIFCRHVELRGRIHRAMSILKMRESGYDPYVREFEITKQGIRILDPLQSAEGLLTGVVRSFDGAEVS